MTRKNLFEDNCDRPACAEISSMMKQAAEASSTAAHAKPKSTVTKATTTANCPPGSAALGQSSWTLLHSMVRLAREFCGL